MIIYLLRKSVRLLHLTPNIRCIHIAEGDWGAGEPQKMVRKRSPPPKKKTEKTPKNEKIEKILHHEKRGEPKWKREAAKSSQKTANLFLIGYWTLEKRSPWLRWRTRSPSQINQPATGRIRNKLFWQYVLQVRFLGITLLISAFWKSWKLNNFSPENGWNW